MRWRYRLLIIVVILLLLWTSIRPSNARDWNEDQSVLSYYEREGDLIHIYNIRNFTYISATEYIPSYYNKTFNLSELDSVDFIVEPFGSWSGTAHTFVSFGFNDTYLSISIEIRKEVNESFSGLKGLFKNYEIMYVVGDENDLVKLRSNYRMDQVYIYPVKTEKEEEMLLEMLDRVNKLKEEPEFYNTATNTCTTNLVKHVNVIAPKRVPFSFKILFPGYSDQLAYDIGLIETNMSFEDTRNYYNINTNAAEFANDPNFSLKIRDYE